MELVMAARRTPDILEEFNPWSPHPPFAASRLSHPTRHIPLAAIPHLEFKIAIPAPFVFFLFMDFLKACKKYWTMDVSALIMDKRQMENE
jgi:hypothetical protein